MLEGDQQRCNEETSLLSSLKSFRSEFDLLIDKTKDSIDERASLSLKTIGEYLKLLQVADQTFGRVVVGTSKRTNEKEEKLVSCYLKSSTLYLGLLNSITSCLFHLGEATLRLLNGFALLETSPADALSSLKPIAMKHVEEEPDAVSTEDEEDDVPGGLKEVGWVWFWVCYTALAGLSDDSAKWVEKRRKVCLLSASFGRDDGWEVKEIVEINKCLIKLLSDVAEGKDVIYEGERVKKMIQVLGDELDELQKEVDRLFFDVLGVRDELLNAIRVTINPQS